MPAARYPAATWKGDGQSGGSWTGGPYRVVLHTTETRTLPGYQGGATAPHLTYSPASRTWWQHTAMDRAARALRNNPGGVETNRRRAIQVEIICYSDRATAERVGGTWVGHLPDTAYQDLAAFCAWTGVQAVWPERRALSYGQANAAGFRMNAATWNDFGGVCGHQHVPENLHWDPGALDIARIVDLMKGPPMSDDITARNITATGTITANRVVVAGQVVEQGGEPGVNEALAASWEWAIAEGLWVRTASPDQVLSREELARWVHVRLKPWLDKNYSGGGGGVTEARVREIIAASKIVP